MQEGGLRLKIAHFQEDSDRTSKSTVCLRFPVDKMVAVIGLDVEHLQHNFEEVNFEWRLPSYFEQ